MPTAALAISGGLVIANNVFTWVVGGGDFIVRAFDPEPASLFAENSSWTLTINGDSRPGTVTEVPGILELIIDGSVPVPSDVYATLEGTLTGPGGITSNIFQIRSANP